jgi:hypothetical protein
MITLVLLLLLADRSFAAQPPGALFGKPEILGVAGSAGILVSRARGGSRVAHAGDPLWAGDSFVTPGGVSVKISYEDGSVVLAGPSTQVLMEDVKETLSVSSSQGVIRAIVVPLPPSAPRPKHARFLIRTRSAVMGVRGTDFIVENDAAKLVTEVHELVGVVDVAANEGALSRGQITPLNQGNSLRIIGAQIGTPSQFDRESFLKSFHQQNPGLLELYQSRVRRAPPPAAVTVTPGSAGPANAASVATAPAAPSPTASVSASASGAAAGPGGQGAAPGTSTSVGAPSAAAQSGDGQASTPAPASSPLPSGGKAWTLAPLPIRSATPILPGLPVVLLPVDCVYTTAAQACSASCGPGTQVVKVLVTTPASNGGKPCPNNSTHACNNGPCAAPTAGTTEGPEEQTGGSIQE